jgi:hypothetical protein
VKNQRIYFEMAGRGRVACFICGSVRHAPQLRSIYGEENIARREIAERKRNALNKLHLPVGPDTRICHTCNQSIFNELRERAVNPTDLNVLFQTSSMSRRRYWTVN